MNTFLAICKNLHTNETKVYFGKKFDIPPISSKSKAPFRKGAKIVLVQWPLSQI